MVDRIPSGTRDVLPDEMRELRAMTDGMRDVFFAAGYGEVYTPALEYEQTFATQRVRRPARLPPVRRAGRGARLAPRDDDPDREGGRDALRPRGAAAALLLPGHAYRGVRPQRGQSREFLQAGVELLGSPGADGTAEVLGVMCEALDAAGLKNYRVGLGDASLYPSLLDAFGVPRRSPGQDPHRARAPATSSGSTGRSTRSAWTADDAEGCCCGWPARAAAPRCSRALGRAARRPQRHARVRPG